MLFEIVLAIIAIAVTAYFWTRPSTSKIILPEDFQVLIVGGGFSGLCAAVKMKLRGVKFVLIEKSGSVGGTWLENNYPGAGCDIPSHLYSFSFEPNPNWTSKWATRDEILAYQKNVAKKYGILRSLRLNTTVKKCEYNPKTCKWTVSLSGPHGPDEVTANVVIIGTGQLAVPKIPNLPGRALFTGKQFHSARWDHSYSLEGKRVAVVGTGASTIQFFPEVQKQAKHVVLFQQSPSFVHPRGNYDYSPAMKERFTQYPLLMWLHRLAIYWTHEINWLWFSAGSFNSFVKKRLIKEMKKIITDDQLGEKVIPKDLPGCKRVLISDNYLQSLKCENVTVVDEAVEQIGTNFIISKSQRFNDIDAIIFATGFQTQAFCSTLEIIGLEESLTSHWNGVPTAYLGMTVQGFPNMFIMYGPNTNLGHNSIILMIEFQVNYILSMLEKMSEKKIKEFQVRPYINDAYNQWLNKTLDKTIWATDCHSWYRDQKGNIVNNWAGSTIAYWWKTLSVNLQDYYYRS